MTLSSQNSLSHFSRKPPTPSPCCGRRGGPEGTAHGNCLASIWEFLPLVHQAVPTLSCPRVHATTGSQAASRVACLLPTQIVYSSPCNCEATQMWSTGVAGCMACTYNKHPPERSRGAACASPHSARFSPTSRCGPCGCRLHFHPCSSRHVSTEGVGVLPADNSRAAAHELCHAHACCHVHAVFLSLTHRGRSRSGR